MAYEKMSDECLLGIFTDQKIENLIKHPIYLECRRLYKLLAELQVNLEVDSLPGWFDQISRSTLSILNNFAEPYARHNYWNYLYLVARGSAWETMACADAYKGATDLTEFKKILYNVICLLDDYCIEKIHKQLNQKTSKWGN